MVAYRIVCHVPPPSLSLSNKLFLSFPLLLSLSLPPSVSRALYLCTHTVMSACRVIDQPTVFLGALWLPYARDLDVLRAAMQPWQRPRASAQEGMLDECDIVSPWTRRGGGSGAHAAASDDAAAAEAGGHAKVLSGRIAGRWLDGMCTDAAGEEMQARLPRAIFCHVDVVGADMSGGIMAQRGLGVDEFPPHMPVYTGHYHKPHELWGKAGARQHPLVYVGSQWQTSMSEAHEDKRLLLLDASKGWTVAEEIAIQVGRRHFRAASLSELQENLATWAPRPGDRVQVRVEDAPHARRRTQGLALPTGVGLELVEQPRQLRHDSRIEGADSLDAMALLDEFFKLRDRAPPEDAAEEAGPVVDGRTREAARAVLQEAVDATPPTAQTARAVVFESVELQGFGSFGFGRKVRYPLHERGVVLVMGRNEDDAGADSNGAGKTTLCMAALWALTGSADVRADGKRLGRKDIVHATGDRAAVVGQTLVRAVEEGSGEDLQAVEEEGSNEESGGGNGRGRSGGARAAASVCLRGTIDGVKFEVLRRMSAGRAEAHTLRVSVGGKVPVSACLSALVAERECRRLADSSMCFT